MIRLDKPVRDLKAVEVGVSNAVTGPPSVDEVSSDGRYAVVIEMRGNARREKSIQTYRISQSKLPGTRYAGVYSMAIVRKPASS